MLTNCPEAWEEGLQSTAAALLGPGVSVSPIGDDAAGGVRTIAAAVAGLGVATICRRTPSKAEQLECEHAQLSLQHAEEAEDAVVVGVVWEGVSHKGSCVKVAAGDGTFHRRAPPGDMLLREGIGDSEHLDMGVKLDVSHRCSGVVASDQGESESSGLATACPARGLPTL